MNLDYESIKQNYINAAILHRETLYNRDFKTSNKQYKILKKIYDLFMQNIIDKKILLELLQYGNINVRSWAASHMLGLKYETILAEEELKKISLESGMIGFSAEMTLKAWKENGFLKF